MLLVFPIMVQQTTCLAYTYLDITGVARISPVQLMAGVYATNSCSEMAHQF